MPVRFKSQNLTTSFFIFIFLPTFLIGACSYLIFAEFPNAVKYSWGRTIFLAWRMIAPFSVQDCVKRLFFLRDCDSQP